MLDLLLFLFGLLAFCPLAFFLSRDWCCTCNWFYEPFTGDDDDPLGPGWRVQDGTPPVILDDTIKFTDAPAHIWWTDGPPSECVTVDSQIVRVRVYPKAAGNRAVIMFNAIDDDNFHAVILTCGDTPPAGPTSRFDDGCLELWEVVDGVWGGDDGVPLQARQLVLMPDDGTYNDVTIINQDGYVAVVSSYIEGGSAALISTSLWHFVDGDTYYGAGLGTADVLDEWIQFDEFRVGRLQIPSPANGTPEQLNCPGPNPYFGFCADLGGLATERDELYFNFLIDVFNRPDATTDIGLAWTPNSDFSIEDSDATLRTTASNAVALLKMSHPLGYSDGRLALKMATTGSDGRPEYRAIGAFRVIGSERSYVYAQAQRERCRHRHPFEARIF